MHRVHRHKNKITICIDCLLKHFIVIKKPSNLSYYLSYIECSKHVRLIIYQTVLFL